MYVYGVQAALNRKKTHVWSEPSMRSSGCLELQLDGDAAQDCASFLQESWVEGRCRLTPNVTLAGFNTYDLTLKQHSPKQQAVNTLLIETKHIPTARTMIPGFHAMETALKFKIERTLGFKVELHSAHGLKQGPHTTGSTAFSWHQDDDEHKSIVISAGVKLTGDFPGEGPSRMCVAGAPDLFQYSSRTGSTAVFYAHLIHSSVIPLSEREHLKMVFFFNLVSIYICLNISIN